MLLENVDLLILNEFSDPYFKVRYSGPYVLASYLRNRGYRVQILDYVSHFTDAQLVKALRVCVGPKTLAVGLAGTFTVSLKATYSAKDTPEARTGWPLCQPRRIDLFLDTVRSINPETKIIMGGHRHGYDYPRDVDTLFLGFSEVSLFNYLETLRINNSWVPKVVQEEKQEGWNRDVFLYSEEDNILPGETLPLEISRGCIFNCKYCTYPRRGAKDFTYVKDEDVIRTQLSHNYDKFGVLNYTLTDDTHNDTEEKLKRLIRVQKELGIQIRYSAYARLDLIHTFPHTADLLFQAGMRGPMFGIETLNWEAGKMIGKGLHPDKVRATLHRLRAEWGDEVGTEGMFILGLPKQSRLDMVRMAKELMDPSFPLHYVIFYALIIQPLKEDSAFNREPEKFGYDTSVKAAGNWVRDDGFTADEARQMQILYTNQMIETQRNKFGGVLPFLVSNGGRSLQSMIGKPLELSQRDYIDATRYMERYLAKVFSED
jgi:radical SAM superfamily enzyme YgiQ (UPF0313 family)